MARMQLAATGTPVSSVETATRSLNGAHAKTGRKVRDDLTQSGTFAGGIEALYDLRSQMCNVGAIPRSGVRMVLRHLHVFQEVRGLLPQH